MGIFSQDKTTTNQTAYNQQVATSNRDLSGQQVVAGAGARIVYTSLDERALQTAAATVNNALAANTATSQNSLQGFQSALGILTEHQNTQQSLDNQAKQTAGQQSSLLGQTGFSPTIILGVAAIIAAVVIFTYRKK